MVVETLDSVEFGSPKSDGGNHDLASIANHEIHELREKHGPDAKFILWGKSMGGLKSAETVTGPDADHVLGVIYDSVPMGKGREGVVEKLLNFVENVAQEPEKFEKLLNRVGVVFKSDVLDFFKGKLKMLFGVYKSHMNTNYFEKLTKHPLSIDTVAIVGTNDPILFMAGCDATSIIPNATRLFVPGMGHGLNNNPEAMYRIVYKMMKDLNDPERLINI